MCTSEAWDSDITFESAKGNGTIINAMRNELKFWDCRESIRHQIRPSCQKNLSFWLSGFMGAKLFRDLREFSDCAKFFSSAAKLPHFMLDQLIFGKCDPGGLGSSLVDIAGYVGTATRHPIQSLFKNDMWPVICDLWPVTCVPDPPMWAAQKRAAQKRAKFLDLYYKDCNIKITLGEVRFWWPWTDIIGSDII